jgi:hypothetical protein
MIDSEITEGIQAVVDAIQRSGRPFQVRNGECNTRCPFCGDSSKSTFAKHLYISMQYSHKCFCQRCGFSSTELTVEILEALGADEREAGNYVRAVGKEQRRSGRGRRRGGPKLGLVQYRMAIPPPCRDDPADAAAIGYIERRLGLTFEDREVQRYKIVACGLYGLLAANGIETLTVKEREADRLNDTCVGFLSADESYAIFRTMDDEFVKGGGRRYTNYRIYREWEGTKAFAARSDVDLLSPDFRIVQAEGILDLIGIERTYYPEERWLPHFVGAASNGSAHGSFLRMLIGVGIIGASLDLYIDNEPAQPGKPSNLARARTMLDAESPFFRVPSFKVNIYQNEFGPPGTKKDFGVPASEMSRGKLKV